jgi:Sec-independent protein secretion pathway component TatC
MLALAIPLLVLFETTLVIMLIGEKRAARTAANGELAERASGEASGEAAE